MQSLAKKISYPEPTLESGIVLGRDQREFYVRTDRGRLEARRARSCLVEPASGDRVLLAAAEDRVWILAVLEGDEGSSSRLVAEGDLDIQAPSGKIRIGSAEGIELLAGKEVSVEAATFDVHAIEGSAVFQRLTLIGATLRADLGAVKTVLGTIDSVVERVTQRAKRVYRFIEEFDQLRAEVIDYAATKNAMVRGENTVMTARECIKIDGEQVHIG